AELVSRHYVQKGRLASARGFAGCAFADQSFSDQFANQNADNTARHPHPAGEVCPRNWLMFAYQVQRNSAVNIPGSGPRSNVEIVRIDLTHQPILFEFVRVSAKILQRFMDVKLVPTNVDPSKSTLSKVINR